AFGGSVPPEITEQIEVKLGQSLPPADKPGKLEMFDPWVGYCQGLQQKVDIAAIKNAILSEKLKVYVDVMHGAAASGLERLLGCPVSEINSDRDPLFGGGAPEPLPKYLPDFFKAIKAGAKDYPDSLRVGLVFDGDSDRIAGADAVGNFLSSQVLIPILIEHLAERKGFTGEIVKTVSGSDLIPRLAKSYGRSVYETPIGYKYIGDRMLQAEVMIGGEESGGIGYGTHIPERDALLSALYVLEAVVQSGEELGTIYRRLQQKTDFTAHYDRIDLPLANMEVRAKLLARLQHETPKEVAGMTVIECLDVDGYKFRMDDNTWLLIRFSGTEPVLRLYCQATTMPEVHKVLEWAKDWANS
ncbi:MAG: hypothetical protein RLZZ499_1610, partial [Cyanobacteriota bacterium]